MTGLHEDLGGLMPFTQEKPILEIPCIHKGDKLPNFIRNSSTILFQLAY